MCFNVKQSMKRLLAVLLFLLFLLVSCAPVARDPNAPSVADALPAPRLAGMTSSAYVVLAGERVYYEVGGSGTPVVFVHGIGAGNSMHLYRQNSLALSQQHRVYAFDFPGFARSGARPIMYTNELYVQVLREFLQKVVGVPAAIIGGSYGADYAIRVAAENPELITKLLLANPSGYGFSDEARFARGSDRFRRNPDLFTQYATTPIGLFLFQILSGEGGLNFFLYNTVYLNVNLVTPELTRIYQQNLEGANKAFAPFSFFAGMLAQDVSQYWAKLGQPAYLVWGNEDVFTPITESRYFLEARPVPMAVVRARAVPYDEAFEKFNAIALRFLK
jgi:pimeloyl-ACP methyl ester carboxylesterase